MAKNSNYNSDAMNFIRNMVESNPQIKNTRNNLRKTWWDKDFNEVNAERELDQDNLKSDGYVYFNYK